MSRFTPLPLLLLVVLGACSQDEGAAPPAESKTEAVRPPVTDTRAPAATVSAAPTVEPRIEPIEEAATTDPDAPPELEWDALIPDEYQPEKLLAEYQIDDLADDDPRAAELMAKLQEFWDQAPVREDLDGRQIRLPGFVVPVEADEEETTGFLLVPYYGACIHVPPPPANQTVYVLTETGKGTRPELFDVIWVTGTMSVSRIENDIAEAGYTLYATDIAPYE